MKDDATNEVRASEAPSRRPDFDEDRAVVENADPSDSELLAMFGIDEAGLDASIAEYECGDWSRMRFGEAAEGRPEMPNYPAMSEPSSLG